MNEDKIDAHMALVEAMPDRMQVGEMAALIAHMICTYDMQSDIKNISKMVKMLVGLDGDDLTVMTAAIDDADKFMAGIKGKNNV